MVVRTLDSTMYRQACTHLMGRELVGPPIELPSKVRIINFGSRHRPLIIGVTHFWSLFVIDLLPRQTWQSSDENSIKRS